MSGWKSGSTSASVEDGLKVVITRLDDGKRSHLSIATANVAMLLKIQGTQVAICWRFAAGLCPLQHGDDQTIFFLCARSFFLLLFFFLREAKKKSLGSGEKNRVGRVTVTRQFFFFLPYMGYFLQHSKWSFLSWILSHPKSHHFNLSFHRLIF